jgi:tRNA-dihydrouridine synthase B
MKWINLEKPIVALAAMDGVTDSAFRSTCMQFGADMCFTEFIHVRGMFENSEYRDPILYFQEDEKPVVVQLYGNIPEEFYRAAVYCLEKDFDGIDINMGCPAKNVAQHGSGCALMKDAKKASEIVKAVLKARDESGKDIPVTVKMRIGFDEVNAVEFAKVLEDAGAEALIVHGRTLKQAYRGLADWSVIGDVAASVKIPVIGNGDVANATDVKRALDLGCKGVTIGRNAIGNPWIFSQIKAELAGNSSYVPDPAERRKVCLEHAIKMYERKGDHGIIELRKHFGSYFRGFENASEFRMELMQTTSFEALKEILEK